MAIDKKGQLQHCARKIYAQRLRQAGFKSYHQEDLNWYRVINGQVLQSIYLFSTINAIPLIMSVGYGHHPLFIPAPMPQKIVFGDFGEDERMRWIRKLNASYSTFDGTLVMCQDTERHGAETLDEDVFPIFNIAVTEVELYKLHREICIEEIKKYRKNGKLELLQIIGSEWLADEAIYFDDKEVQELIIGQLIRRKKGMEEGEMLSTLKRQEWYQARINAIQSGDRKTFMTMLEARKRRFIKDLDRKLGIQV